MPAIKITNKLKYYRERRALSQEQLAQLSGVHKLTIYRIEQERTRVPYPKTRTKIATALKMEVYRIFPPVYLR